MSATTRLKRSCIYAAVAVIVSTIAFISLASLDSPRKPPGPSASGIDLAADVVGLPLAPGWVLITAIFGDWGAVHGGQILLVPFISAGIDTGLIFVVWQFFYWKKSRGLDSDNVLHINR